MHINKFALIFSLIIPLLTGAFTKTAHFTLKNNLEVIVRPITNSPIDKKTMYKILQDPDVCKTMRDGLPWPEHFIENTHRYYVEAWNTYYDLESLNITEHNLTFAFIIYTADGKPVGLGGIQSSTRGEPYKEIYFELLAPYRRQGLGGKFGQFLVNTHKSLFGNKPIEAVVVPENAPSKGLLRKLGFKPRLGKNGKPDTHIFPKWNNRLYEIFRLTPQGTA